jgi:hypothetical protein
MVLIPRDRWQRKAKAGEMVAKVGNEVGAAGCGELYLFH